jgi:integrase
MSYKLIDPDPKRSPYYRIRGTEFGQYINRSTQTRDKREAVRFLAAWREEAKLASISGPVKPTTSFAGAALAYMHAEGEKRFLAPLLRYFGETPLSNIDQAAIDAAAVSIYPNASSATRNRQVYSPMSAILRRAGLALPLRRPKGAQGKARTGFLSTEQAFELLAAATALHARFGALLTFLLYSGVRLSEALRVNWADVDLQRAVALIRETKNGKPMTVHLPPAALSALANLDDRAGRVFRLTKSGRLYKLWADAATESGLTLPPRSAFHILRHTHATWRRLYTGADTTALTQTGLWRSRSAAAIYEHVDATAESRKADLLPTPTRAKSVRRRAQTK